MKLNRFLLAAAAVLAVACTPKDPVEPVTPSKAKVEASLADLSKTAINDVKVTWTAGDDICINGIASDALEAAAQTATFNFKDELELPYNAVSPANLYKDAETVTLPSTLDAATLRLPLVGYSTTAGQIDFSALTAVVKVVVAGTADNFVQNVKFSGLGGEQICGDFGIDCQTGALTGKSTADEDKVITVSCNTSLANPLTIYIPVPAGEYPSGLKLELVGQDNETMVRATGPRTLAAGQLRAMPSITWGVNGIADAADFMAFAKAVNAGTSTAQWEDKDGFVNLVADINFAELEEPFVPVGFATAAWTSYVPTITAGNAFTGKFDGNAHHIKNLHLVCSETEAGNHYGIFGYLGKGAVVRNFVIEDNCSLTVNTNVSLSAGMIAGVMYDAEVRDITSYAPMTYGGGATGLLHMALIGGAYAKDTGCVVDSVHNFGEINAPNTANQNASAAGIHVAGIMGFTNAVTGGEPRIVISNCNNNGNITSAVGRSAGIVGAANACTDIVGCENRGNQLNTMTTSGGTRLGNIVCLLANGSTLTSCKNYGNLVSTTAGRCGGIFSLASSTGPFTNCENYGEIITDSDYRGVFFGYLNVAAVFEGGVASGKVGKYNEGTWQYDVYTEANKQAYLGKTGGSAASGSFNNITYDILTEENPADPDINVEAGFRIFFIGNSFTKDAVEHLPGIIHAAGLNDVQLVHMYYGGRTIPEYYSGWATSADYHCYLCNPGKTSWTDITGKSLDVVASAAKFDIVTIQEHTGRLLAWGWTETEKAAVNGLVQKVKDAQTALGANPKLYYILSQAYFDLSKAQNVDKPFTTQLGMWEKIAEQGRHAVEECGFDGVISTGVMLQNLRTTKLNTANDLTRDGYHMDYGLARYGAACTVFESIIGPFNGNVTLDNNSFRYNVSSTSTGSWSTPVTDENAPVALLAARNAIASPYEITDMKGEGGGGEEDPEEVENISISSLAELQAFAARVNEGDKGALTANVTLTSDLDFGSLNSWTPIGNIAASGNGNNASGLQANVFKGVFDGGGHTLSNFNFNVELEEGNTWGLFGYTMDATVKNFKVQTDITFSTAGTADAGVVVGTANSSTVEDIEVSGKITCNGASVSGKRFAVGGVVGFAFSTVNSKDGVHDCNIRNCTVTATVNADGGANLANGATGVMYGGIAGFCTNAKDDSRIRITNCVNNGTMTAKIGRCSGIAPTANYGTIFTSCTNNASQVNTISNGRIGQIVCNLSAQSALIDCQNNGDLTTTDSKTTTGGLVALVGDDTAYIEGGERVANTATIISGFDPNTDSAKRRFSGLIGGNLSKFNHISDVKVSGRLGVYKEGADPEMFEITQDNFMTYVANITASYVSKITNMTYVEQN